MLDVRKPLYPIRFLGCSSDRTISELLGKWKNYVNADWTRQLETSIMSQQVEELLAS